MKIAFLGMGIMGGPMAANMSRHGHEVRIYNRTPGRPGEIEAIEAGCTPASTAAEAAKAADVICLCLSDSASVEAVLFGENGALSVTPAQTIVDFSTIGQRRSLAIANRLKTNGIAYIDAPVSGGESGARSGQLVAMVGAPDVDRFPLRDVFQPVAGKVFACGKVGKGQALKLVNQSMVAANLLGVCEAIAAAKALDMDISVVLRACSGGAASSWQLEHLGPKIADRDFAPGFRMEHFRKDLALLEEDLAGRKVTSLAKRVAEIIDKLCKTDEEFGERGTQALIAGLSET